LLVVGLLFAEEKGADATKEFTENTETEQEQHSVSSHDCILQKRQNTYEIRLSFGIKLCFMRLHLHAVAASR